MKCQKQGMTILVTILLLSRSSITTARRATTTTALPTAFVHPSKTSSTTSTATSRLFSTKNTKQSSSSATSSSKSKMSALKIKSLSTVGRKCIPTLSSSSHKGSSGRIGILGGSEKYTGAPYYAGMAALKTGSDLVTVMCAEEAAVPIKCYSPELMVDPVYSSKAFQSTYNTKNSSSSETLILDEQTLTEEQLHLVNNMVESVCEYLNRLHVLIIGPGLGRCPLVMYATGLIIEKAKDLNLPLVVDADGLYLFTKPKYLELLNGYYGAIITPNAVEYNRLMRVNNFEDLEAKRDLSKNVFDGVVIVKKGFHDVISQHSSVERDRYEEIECEEIGGLKRSGGIGDVLSGTIATLLAWNGMLDPMDRPSLLDSAWTACAITKKATLIAFCQRKRGMTAPDVLEVIWKVVDEAAVDGPCENALESLTCSSL